MAFEQLVAEAAIKKDKESKKKSKDKRTAGPAGAAEPPNIPRDKKTAGPADPSSKS